MNAAAIVNFSIEPIGAAANWFTVGAGGRTGRRALVAPKFAKLAPSPSAAVSGVLRADACGNSSRRPAALARWKPPAGARVPRVTGGSAGKSSSAGMGFLWNLI